MNRPLATACCALSALSALLLPLTVLAQSVVFASASIQPRAAQSANRQLVVEPVESAAPTATTLTAERPTLCLGGTYSLSDGPLTIELLDGMGRPVLRRAMPATDTDGLRLPALALPIGTYAARVLDAHGRELHHQRVVSRPQ